MGERSILDVEDASRLKKCHRATIWRAVERGLLKPISRYPYLFRRQDIERLPMRKPGRPKTRIQTKGEPS